MIDGLSQAAIEARKLTVIATGKRGQGNDPGPYRANHVFAVIGFDAKSKKWRIQDSGWMNDPCGEPAIAGRLDLSLDDLYKHFNELKLVR